MGKQHPQKSLKCFERSIQKHNIWKKCKIWVLLLGVKNVKVTIEANEAFTVQGENTQRLTFEQPDEKMAYFQLKINDFLMYII